MNDNGVRAPLSEIFTSIQGEGIFIGYRHIFVRFVGCNLSCPYCDTPQADEVPLCRVNGQSVGNPLTPQDVARYVDICRNVLPVHAISLTGGEPLLHSDFIAQLVPLLHHSKILLETNGTLVDSLRKILPLIDVISMDVKLGQDTLALHERFLRLAVNRPTYVKMVVDSATDTNELADAVHMVHGVSAKLPIVIQPVTARNGVTPPSVEQLIADLDLALAIHYGNVRVIPQIHPMLHLP